MMHKRLKLSSLAQKTSHVTAVFSLMSGHSFLISSQSICCGYSVEAPLQDIIKVLIYYD